MDNQSVTQLIQTIGLPTAFSVYLLISNNKHMEKYELLIDKISGELKDLNDNIKYNQQNK